MLELGRMTTLWGSLEAGLAFNVEKLAGFDCAKDARGLILIAHANFQQRLHMLSSLCIQLEPEHPHLAKYGGVVKKIEFAQKARNKYSHNSVYFNDETGQMNTSSFSSRGQLKLNIEVVEMQHIQEASAKIHEAICALHTLVTQVETMPMWDRADKS